MNHNKKGNITAINNKKKLLQNWRKIGAINKTKKQWDSPLPKYYIDKILLLVLSKYTKKIFDTLITYKCGDHI